MAAQPIVALTAVQDDFQAGEPDRDENDPDIVDAQLAPAPSLSPFRHEPRRIVNQPARQQKRGEPNWNVDEENPTP